MQNRITIYGFDQDFITVVGALTQEIQSGRRFNGDIFNSSHSNGDKWQYIRYFTKGGLYKVRVVCITENNFAKIDIGLDSSTNKIFSQLDLYTVSSTPDTVKETFVEISRGYHTISWLINGKNASSSDFFSAFQAIEFDLVQEYPVYQDDRSAQINQGSMVLLGKHVAAIAESTFTFNFSDIKFSKYSEIMIKINGGATASLELQAIINGLNSGISQNGYTAIGASLTVVNLSARSSVQLASTAVLTGATDFVGTILLKRNASNVWEVADCDFTGYGVGTEKTSASLGSPTSTSLDKLVIQTSTSTWKVGTEIEIYGNKTN